MSINNLADFMVNHFDKSSTVDHSLKMIWNTNDNQCCPLEVETHSRSCSHEWDGELIDVSLTKT